MKRVTKVPYFSSRERERERERERKNAMDRISAKDKKCGVLALFIITKELFIGFA